MSVDAHLPATLAPFPPQPVEVPWPSEAWPTGPVPPHLDGAAIRSQIAEAFDPASAPVLGATSGVLVVVGGRLVLAEYADGIDPGSTFPSWSMSKSVLAAAVGLLIRDGRLGLDTKVAWPGWSDPDDARQQLTVLDLLRMRASLEWAEAYSADVPSDVVEMLFGSGAQDPAAYTAGKPLVGPPGSVYEYSSGTSNLLAWVFGRAFDHDPDRQLAYLRAELFDPIGMTTALPKFDATGTWIASTYCFATAEDFARFGLLLLRGGEWDGRQILPRHYVDEMRTPQPEVWDEGWGYGLHVWRRPECGEFFAMRGYQAQYVFLAPAHDVMVVRLGVTSEELKRNAAAWTVRLLERLCVRR